jgi:uncharacterized protein (TIGR00299 family) protein
MTIAYIDAFSGLAGDMTVGALIDAGANAEALVAGLDTLATGAQFTVEKVQRQGIAATRFVVGFEPQHTHRHLSHIVRMIQAAGLPARVKARAIKIFETLGAAEAQVHGVPVDKVHFHEVGAIDSICDIVGACLGFELLGIDEIYCSAINTGSGTVEAAHGVMPVPAPATALLLAGKPVYARGPATELTTPTGAAIVAALAAGFGAMPPLRLSAQGFGAGAKELAGMANVVRVIVGQPAGATEATTVEVIEANIDDTTPEVLGYAMERLLEAGALDVTYTPVLMKKQRPGVTLSVIARPEQSEALMAVIFRETTTLGVRCYTAGRRVQERRFETVETPYGPVKVKTGAHGAAPEYEDARAVALNSGAALRDVMAAAMASWSAAHHA